MSQDPFALATEQTRQPHCFLVVVDKSEEMHKALRFAAMRAANLGGKVALLGVIAPANFAHWVSVGELMKEEARAQLDALLAQATEQARLWSGSDPIVYIREGEPTDVITKLIREEEQIKLLVLAADARDGAGPGPLVSAFSSRALSNSRVPITIVPGNLTYAQIDAIC